MKTKKSKKGERGQFEDQGSRALATQDRLLFGEVPQPWAPRRLMAANAMGFKFFKLNADERAQLADANYVYDGMFWDAVLCAFLCSCKAAFLFRAVRLPDAAVQEVMTWADEKKLTPGAPNWDDVMNHYNSVMEAIIRSSAEEVPLNGTASGNGEAATDHLPGE